MPVTSIDATRTVFSVATGAAAQRVGEASAGRNHGYCPNGSDSSSPASSASTFAEFVGVAVFMVAG